MDKKNLQVPSLFKIYKNTKNKLVYFKINKNTVGDVKYLPPISKEWKNSICLFNINNLKNLLVHDIGINSLIKAFFNLYFNLKFLKKKYKRLKFIRSSTAKIYVSKIEIQHTNHKAIITLHVYNRERRVLLKKIKKLRKSFFKTLTKMFNYKDILILKKLNEKLKKTKFLWILFKKNDIFINKNIYKYLILLKKDLNRSYFRFKRIRKKYVFFRKFKLKLDLNRYKFQEIFLFKLSELISKFTVKKVEFIIVNLKSMIFNPDLFTKILALKIKKNKANVIKAMRFVLNKTKLPQVNSRTEKSSRIKTVDLNLLENRYNNLHLQSIINQNNLDEKLTDIYSNVFFHKDLNKIHEIIFNNIKYKNIGGIRLEVRGRLTRRYRADRAIYKIKWKGGLKNIDSSYKNLSSVIKKGYMKSNVEYSIFTSKRRIGAFAVKGWISGK